MIAIKMIWTIFDCNHLFQKMIWFKNDCNQTDLADFWLQSINQMILFNKDFNHNKLKNFECIQNEWFKIDLQSLF